MAAFRLAKPQDAKALKRLNDEFNGENCNTVDGIAASLAQNPQEVVCVAEADGAVVGFCCGQIFKSMCYSVHYGEITELYVTDKHRRSGIGRGLMAYIESEFQNQGIHDYQLFTGKDNETAQKFYHACGYQETAELMLRKRIGGRAE